jgi:hypothetical protein
MGELWQDACQAWIQLVSSENTSLSCLPGGVDLPAAKLERRRIKERTVRGRADAKANGVKFGRKPKLTPHQKREAIKRRDKDGETFAVDCSQLQCQRGDDWEACMRDDAFYDDLPDDPEAAFLYVESQFRTDCETKVAQAHQEERVDVYYVQYISRVLGAITELGLESKFSDQSVPTIDDVNYSTYVNFSKDVDHYLTRLRIRHARRRKNYSVALDATTKTKLRHLLTQIKETVDKLDVPQKKKEALFSKISALEGEINRDRTPFDAFAALWIEGCEKAGEGFEKLKPLRDLCDSIGNLIGVAKKAEENTPRQLPAPPPQKQIPPPQSPPDDDIPF